MPVPDDPTQMTRALPVDARELTREPFAVVLTLDGYLQLVKRVEELERAPYAEPDRTSAKALLDLDERLRRHREDIDALKEWANDLLGVLRPYLGLSTPTAPTRTTGGDR